MPQSKFQRPEFGHGDVARAHRYFATVHGDVAALQARIERGFADYAYESAPASPLGLEQAVESFSRMAGLVGLIAALGAIAYTLI